MVLKKQEKHHNFQRDKKEKDKREKKFSLFFVEKILINIKKVHNI